MGKAQKKKAFRRHNPVRVPDSHLPKGLEAASSTSSRKDAVLPIIQKLESAEALERTWACSAVSNLIQNDPSTRRLLQGKNIVGVLVTRLSDSVEEVVVEAAGALRNLCIDGGYDICAEMYNKNILAPLKTFVPKISAALHELVTSPKSAPENAADLVYGLAENVITILWCLSETSNKALNAINQIQLVPFLMAFLENRVRLPARTVAAAAQCLYVLSDDNDPAIEELRSNSSYVACLLAVAQAISAPTTAAQREPAEERLTSVRLLAAGILRNIAPIPAPSSASSIDFDRSIALPLVTPVISSVSLLEASNKVTELIAIEDEPLVSSPSLKHTPKSDHVSPKERELELIEARLRNVQLSLEILTGVCATLPDPEPGVNDADVDANADAVDVDADDHSDGGEDDEMDTDRAPNGAVDAAPDTAPSTSASYLPVILDPLLRLLQPTPLSFPPLPTPAVGVTPDTAAPTTPPTHPPTTAALSAIHIGALECLNNIFLALAAQAGAAAGAGGSGGRVAEALAADVATGVRVWGAVWAALGAVGVQVDVRGQERRREVWEVAVGVLWGVAAIWKGKLVPDVGQTTLLIQFCEASSDEQVKVKCTGALECLAQHPESIEANRVIGQYLASLLSATSASNTSLSPVPTEQLIQAANALIDIYSDETLPYDVNFREGGFLDILAGSIERVRRAVRGIDRKRPGGRALRLRGEEVLENLRAFVKYRKDLRF